MANRYTRALKQIKDATLDEKLKLLEDLPTNNTTGLYTDVPGYPAPEITVPGDIDSPLDLEEDGDGSPGYTGNDTTGLFETDGTIRAVEPPGDTSYVLGPMMSMWYAWGNFTQIGYVRQSDRRMVNLARITGELSAWDGSSNFTSYGQLTVEQAVWFKNQTRQDYRAFYPGPPSNPADEYGRYIGSIVAESKPTERIVPENPYLRYVDGTGRAADPSDTFSLMMDRNAELGDLVYRDPKALQDYINNLSPEEADSLLFDNSISLFGDTDAAAASAEYNIGREMASSASNPNLAGRTLRSATDTLRYSGDTMFQGNPAGRAPGLSNYWSPDPATAGTYSRSGSLKGVPGASPSSSGTLTTAQRPPGTPRVTRSPLGQPQFKFPKGSPPPGKMITQMADSAAVSAGRRAAATTVGKTISRAVPIVSIGIAAADAGYRASQGDYAGAVLSGISAVPGPIGWAALGVQIATDAVGATGVREEQEFNNYGDYLENARKVVKKNGIKIDSDAMLDLFLRGLSKESKLSNQDKEFLVAIFTDAEGLEKDDVVSFVDRIQDKLLGGKKVEEGVHSVIRKNLFEQEQATGGGTITAHTDAGDVTITIPSKPPTPPSDTGSGMQTTPQEGLPTDYSKQQLKYLRAQKSEYFVAGSIKYTAENHPEQLEKMFVGTTVSWYQVVRMTSEINEVEKARTEAHERANEIWDEVHPQIRSLLSRLDTLRGTVKVTASTFYSVYLPIHNEIDRLFARHDQATAYAMSLSTRWLDMNGRLGRYVQSGKLVDVDPFKLNDPTIKKEKELDEQEINKLIAELKKAASDAQRAALLNKLKAFGYGALLAAGAVIGFKLLLGGAGLKALGAPLVNLLRKLAPKVTKTPVPKPPVPKPPTKPFQNASDAFIRAITDSKNMSRAQDAISKAPKGFKNDVGIQINIGGKTQTVNAADILKFKGFQVNSHQPSGKILTESQKRSLRNVKKPVQVKEIPTKVKVKPTSRKNKTVGADMMKTPKVPEAFKPEPQIWNSSDKKKNLVASQDKKNQVLELVGAAEHHWSYLTEEKRRKRQERVNEEHAARYDREMEDLYEKYKARQDKVDKTISSFKKSSDVAPEYPKTAPPEMDLETGMHPKYGKKYKHDKLDPHSAEFMPPTGDPVIDANIKKATNTKEKQRKTKILYKSVRENTYWNRLQKWRYCGAVLDEGMTSGGLFSYLLQPTGDVVNTEITVNDSSSFSADSGAYILGGGGSFAPFDYTIDGNFNGTLSGQSAFTFSAPFNVPGDVTPHRTNIESFDQSTNVFTVENDTITFSAIAGNSSSNGSGLGSNGGTRPTNDLYVSLYVIEDDGSETYVDLGTVPRTTTSLTNFEFKIPQSAFGKQAYLNLYNPQYTTANNWWYGTTLPWHPEGVNDNGVVEDFHMILNHANLNPASGWPSLDKTTIALMAWTDMQQALAGSSWDNDGGPAGHPAPVSGGTRKLGEQDAEGNTIPEAMTMADLEYIVSYIESTFAQYRGMTTTTYGITNLQFKRQLPMSVFVGLDDPEASAFVRDGDFDRLSPSEKKKKLEEQLAASAEYLNKMFGEGMPGTATEIADYEPQQSFSDIALGTEYGSQSTYGTKPDGTQGFPEPGELNKGNDGKWYEYAPGGWVPVPSVDAGGGDTQVASARGPYGTPGADKPYTRKGYKDKDGKFVDFDNPATWPKIPKADKKKPKQTTMVADYKPKGLYISEKKKLKSPKSLADKIPGYYDGKPSPLGFPVEEPPKMKNGYHPDLVDGKKVSQRYNRLDPISAKAMPPTGNPHIDKKVKAAAAKGKDKTFKEFWVPITGNGPTNSASQTFEFGGEGGPQFTANGLGGQTYPDAIEVFGDPIPTPDYSQLAMQGYTPPLSNEVMKRDKQDENLQKIKDALKDLGTSWEEMRANNWALVKPDGTSILLEPITPGDKQLNWIDNSKITVGKQHPDAEEKPYKVVNPDGSVTIENSKIESVKEFRVGDELNKQLDASEKFTKEIDADEFMKGRVTDTTEPQKSFLDAVADAVADAFGAGTAKNVFDYHMDWNKTQDPSPQDLTRLVTPEDKKLLQDLVDKHSSNATDELIELGINSELQHTIGLSHGLRNSLGVLDHPRGDGARIEGNNIVIRKAYDFEGGFVGGATGLTGIPASIYGMTQGAWNKTGAMDMFVRVPLRRRKKVNESTWNKLKRRRGA